MAPASGFDGLVEVIENQVTEPRGDDTALRTALSGSGNDAVFADSSFEKRLDEIQNAPVGDASRNAGHHHGMRDSVEEGSDIRIYNNVESFLRIPNHRSD